MIINVVYEQCIIGMCRIQRMKKKELYLCLCAMALSKVVYLTQIMLQTLACILENDSYLLRLSSANVQF